MGGMGGTSLFPCVLWVRRCVLPLLPPAADARPASHLLLQRKDSRQTGLAPSRFAVPVGTPPLQRRRSSCDESSASGSIGSGGSSIGSWEPFNLAPKQLQFGGSCSNGKDCSGPAAAPAFPGRQHQPCSEWVQFKAFMSSPQHPSAPPAAPPTVAEPGRQSKGGSSLIISCPPPVEQTDQQQPMDVDSPEAAAQTVVAVSRDSGTAAVTPAPRAAAPAQPLSPRQACAHEQEETPEKPAQHSHPLLSAAARVGKENGSSSSSDGGSGSGWALDTALLRSLSSPATDRAAAAREHSQTAADVISADMLLLLGECSRPASPDGQQTAAAVGPTADAGMAGRPEQTGESTGGSPYSESAAPAQRREQLPGRPAAVGTAAAMSQGCRTWLVRSGESLFQIQQQAVRQQAEEEAPHTGGALDAACIFNNLNRKGRAHSILKPMALPAGCC